MNRSQAKIDNRGKDLYLDREIVDKVSTNEMSLPIVPGVIVERVPCQNNFMVMSIIYMALFL